MQTVAAAFTDALATSHRLASRVLVEGVEVPLADGSVTLDANAAIRGSVSLTLAPDEADLDLLVPDDASSLLAPFGNEIQVYRGYRGMGLAMSSGSGNELFPSPELFPDELLYPGGGGGTSWEGVSFTYGDVMVPLGIFRIDETDVQDNGELGITVTGYDRSARIIDAVFEDAGEFPRGTPILDAILGLIRDGYKSEDPAYEDVELAPDFPATVADLPITLPHIGWQAGEDRWDFCLACAEAANRRLYFDALGRLTLKQITVTEDPVLEISEGEDGILLSASKRWGREDACNRVVAFGENGDAEIPLKGEAIDDDPLSPTYYDNSPGSFGKVTFNYSTEFLPDPDLTDAQNQTHINDVALRILSLKRGVGMQVNWEALVHPALEPLDTILVNRERLKIVRELHTIDSLTIPLGVEGGMAGTTRIMQVQG